MAAITSINSSISYQKGAVVSKEILKKSSGTVTLFAFAAEQGLSEHSTPYDGIAQVTEGSAEITVGGVSHDLNAGDLIIMPANTPHAVKARGAFKMLLTMLRG